MINSFTSELHGEITDNVDKGDDIRTWRVFWFGLFETTSIFFPEQVGPVTQDKEMVELRNLAIEKAEKTGQKNERVINLLSSFLPKN